MYCPNCHQSISDRAKYCPYCSAPQRRTDRRGGGAVLAALVLCAILTTLMLDGGGHRSVAMRVLSPQAMGVQWENPPRGSSRQEKEGELGSAGLLRGDVLLVSLYIVDNGSTWDAPEMEDVQSYVRVACEYLEKEAEAYGERVRFFYDVEEHPDLKYRAEYKGYAVEDETGRFTRWLYQWIDDNVPVADLQKRYGTNNVGFLALVADEGGAYTNVYYVEDSARYFNESSVLFYYYRYVRAGDREVPAVYAHEILHQFGAIDLYEESPDFSPENIEYVARTYPDDIMYGDYVENGEPDYERINLRISPVTAYYLGWLEELPPEDQEGLNDYERVCVGGFSYDDPSFGDD